MKPANAAMRKRLSTRTKGRMTSARKNRGKGPVVSRRERRGIASAFAGEGKKKEDCLPAGRTFGSHEVFVGFARVEVRGDGHVLLEEALGRLGLLGGFDLGEHHVGVCRGAGVEDCGGQISGGQALTVGLFKGHETVPMRNRRNARPRSRPT